MSRASRGFTIVELLIVIVVIAILATISIVAYNGIQERARTSTLKNDLSSAAKQVMLERVKSGTLPTTLPPEVKPSSGIVLQLASTNSADTFCINGYGKNNQYMSYQSRGGIKTYLCDGAAIGSPAGGNVPAVPNNSDLASGFSTWDLSGGVSYDDSSGELVLSSSTSGMATSPLIRINGASHARISAESYATQPSPGYSPDTQIYWGSNYYSADGTTPVQNTSNYTGNGNAQILTLNQWKSFSWTTPAGPGIEYIRFRIHSNPTSRTSDNRYRNLKVEIP